MDSTMVDVQGPGDEPLVKDLYCPFHGRIRDMDSGASPFVDANTAAFAASEAYESDYQRRLQREANEADARGAKRQPKTRAEFLQDLMSEAENVDFQFVKPEGHERLKQIAPEIIMENGCICTWVRQEGHDWQYARKNLNCPIHGDDAA
jgi:hypothetical protein